ncbi:MAG: T9SS type B sorting domain-containing protein, partial [Flavobacteriales bacterium]
TVTINTPPNPGTDGAITLCSTDAAALLFAQLGGTPDVGGSWTGPSAVIGGMIDPATMNAGAYTYTVSSTAPCPDETATVTVTINNPPDPGTDGAITLCSTDTPASLFAQLGGTPEVGGSWTGPSTVAGGMIDPATMSAGVYTYTVSGTAPCPDESATVTVTINTPPNPGTDGAITLCSTDAAASLFAQLGGTPDVGGAWTGPSTVVGGMIDPATMSAGVYAYTVVGTAPCPDETATVTVTINAMPDAGIDGGLTLCSSSPAAQLSTGLNGTPDPGGTWTAPGGGASNGSFTPGTSTVGLYTYTVSGVAPCPAVSAVVDVTVVTNPDAGTPGDATLCASDAAILLFDELGGTPDAGGAWAGPSAVVGGQYDPATMNPGVYTYTITVPLPCMNASSTVTIAEVPPPNAGADGALTLCISSPATALFASLGGSPQAGGAWSGPSPVVGGLFNPATMNAGVYSYTVNGTAPCPNDVATVTVNVVSAPDAGTPGSATLCASGTAIDLFNELGGTPDAGGAWSGPSAVVGGVFDPATMNGGVYTYTIVVPPPCVNATSTVTMTVVQPPNAGSDGALTLCISSPATALFASLGGSPQAGGAWSGPSPVVGGLFNPATMNAGVYSYTVSGTAPCPNDVATVTVTVVSAPDAGTPGSATLCASDTAIDLFGELGGTPDAGGNWSGPSAVVGGMFDPAVMSTGVYTYTIVVPPPCVNATSTVTMTVVQPPNAGTDGALTLCISSPATALFASLGGAPQAGGAWSGPSPVIGGLFSPATMNAGVYTYTVTGTAPCASDAATVTVNVVSTPDPGTAGAIILCASDAEVDLFTELGGTPDAGGAWTTPAGGAFDGTFDPAADVAGIYTYTIAVPPPCASVSATVAVGVVQPPDAGDDGALTLCISSPGTALFPSIGGTPDAGGTWSGPSILAGGLFNPATMNAGVYTYTVAATTPCPADAAFVTITVVSVPDPGGPGFIALCAADAAVDLFSSLEGSPDQGGGWSTPGGGVFSGTFDPSSDAPGVYTYTITVPPPCASVSATVTVDVVQPPDAGIDAAITLCISSPSTPLFPVIGGSPDAGGIWTTPGGAAFAGSFDPALHASGNYSYIVAGTAPCPADVAVVTVTVVTTPDPGVDGTLTLCASDVPSTLFGSLQGTPDLGGAWTAPNGAVFNGTFDPGSSAPGVYTYTINAPPPCSSVSATVTVNVVQPPNAGTDGAITVCATGAPAGLFLSLQGTPDATGTWSGPAGAFNGTFDPNTDVPGTYTYTVAGVAPCPAASASVTVSITQEPDAGSDAILNLCVSGDPVDIFLSLGGADIGGSWSAPGGGPFNGTFTPGTNASGDYTYTVTGTPPCPSASAVITVNQLSNADAGGDGGLTLCSSNTPVELFNELQGTPDPGGIWLLPGGGVYSGMFDPSTDANGTYTYVLVVPLPCVNDTALVVVNVVPASDAGADGSATLCSDDAPIALFNMLGGTPDAGGTWNGPDGANEGQFDPGSDTPGGYTYTVQATAPCPNVSAVVDVAVNPLPDAGTNGSITLCPESAPIDLFSLLGGNPMTGGTWTGPGGVSSNGTFDPSIDTQGIYTYTVFGLAPCPNASASSTATVYLIAAPNAGPDAVTCTLTYTLNATGNWASGTWSGPTGIVFADPSSPGSGVKAPAGGTYTFTWSVLSSDGCATQDQVSITFTDAIIPVVATTDAICHGACDGTASATATGGNVDVDGYSYVWSAGITGNNATASNICAGGYTVTVLDTNGCNTIAPFTIGEPVPLVIDMVGSNPETCPGSCDGMIAVIDPEGAQYSITGGAPFQTDNVFTGLCAGAYSILMIDANGCQASATETVGTPPPVFANFTFFPDTLFVDDPTTQFTNTSSFNAVNFTWDFGGLGTSNEASPQFTFPGGEGGIYTVCLTASDANGCPDTICAPITIYDLLTVYVPNAFTPNGDGYNDGFAPVFNLPWVVDYEFLIFDRWGELLNKSVTVGEQWDGWYGDLLSKTEVYVWKLKCRDQLSGKWLEAVGHVTLLK